MDREVSYYLIERPNTHCFAQSEFTVLHPQYQNEVDYPCLFEAMSIRRVSSVLGGTRRQPTELTVYHRAD